MIVRELELDLDAFEGPFDLLLTLVLKDELDLREIDVAGIVLAFVEHLFERDELDLESCGEFLVLISALLELKARGLFPDEAAELAELEPEAAAEELARRLAEYRRMKDAAAWLRERLETEGARFFRLGPAPLAPKVEVRSSAEPAAPRRGHPPPREGAAAGVARAHGAPLPAREPVPRPLPRGSPPPRPLRLRPGGGELSRVEQAVAFLALLDLRRSGEITIEQSAPFAPIRIARSGQESTDREEVTAAWTLRSA